MERIAAILVILVALGLIGLSFFGPRNFGNGTSSGQFDTDATITIVPGREFDPNRVEMSGGRVQITFRNTNNILHKIEILDPVEGVIATYESIRPNNQETQWVDLVKGRRYVMYAPVWRDKGMEGVIIAH